MAIEYDNTGEEFHGDENDDSEVLPCPSCGELNDGDAKFCDNCGLRFQQQ